MRWAARIDLIKNSIGFSRDIFKLLRGIECRQRQLTGWRPSTTSFVRHCCSSASSSCSRLGNNSLDFLLIPPIVYCIQHSEPVRQPHCATLNRFKPVQLEAGLYWSVCQLVQSPNQLPFMWLMNLMIGWVLWWGITVSPTQPRTSPVASTPTTSSQCTVSATRFLVSVSSLTVAVDYQVDGTAIDAAGHIRHGSIWPQTDSGRRPYHLRVNLLHDRFRSTRYDINVISFKKIYIDISIYIAIISVTWPPCQLER